jgi:hypothetical protein
VRELTPYPLHPTGTPPVPVTSFVTPHLDHVWCREICSLPITALHLYTADTVASNAAVTRTSTATHCREWHRYPCSDCSHAHLPSLSPSHTLHYCLPLLPHFYALQRAVHCDAVARRRRLATLGATASPTAHRQLTRMSRISPSQSGQADRLFVPRRSSSYCQNGVIKRVFALKANASIFPILSSRIVRRCFKWYVYIPHI